MSQLAKTHINMRNKPSKQLTTRLWPLERMIEDSIKFIQEHEPPEGYFVGFSGGKDSIVTLKLVEMSWVKYKAYYSCTGIDPPEVVKFIKEHYNGQMTNPKVEWLYPKYSMWEGIRKKMPPMRTVRWCCDVLKKEPSKHIPLKHRIMGIRSEESNARRSRGAISFMKKEKQTIYKPIFNWLEWHIWEFIEQLGLPYPSLYDEGFHRIGCVVCPFLYAANLRMHKVRWPKYYKTFEHAVRKWWNPEKHIKSSGLIERENIRSADEFLRYWYNDKTPCTCPQNDCAGV